jgi:hypothetical protein
VFGSPHRGKNEGSVEAVKLGALRLEQVKGENAELQDSKRRLEKRLNDLGDVTRIADEVAAILDSFDNDIEGVLLELMRDRLRFNTLMRVFFAELVLEIDSPGFSWGKGRKKGEPPVCNPRITKFALAPRLAAFLDQSGIELPEALKEAERQSPVYRSSFHGSP